ncbi:unnamed protein product [Alopecurus aequalis]
MPSWDESSSSTNDVLAQVENCGFVSWVDGEWPETAQHALGRLWSLLYDSKSERVVEKCDHVQLIHDLALEKHILEKKYSSLVEDVNKYCSDTHRRVMQENYAKIMKEGSKSEVKVGLEKEMDLLKKKIEAQEKVIGELEQIQRSQADVMKGKQDNFDAEKKALKEENKKLEYMIFEMVNASQALKEKLKKIREICDV